MQFKPGRRLTACYDAYVRVEGADTPSARPVAVTWTQCADGDQRQAIVNLAETEAEALRRGVMAPFRKLAADTPAFGMHVQVSPLDLSFRQLVRVCDPPYVSSMVASAYAASGEAPDHAPAARYSVASIRYRPGQRHVLRYDPLDPAKEGTVFAKLYAGNEAARVFRLATEGGEWLAQHAEGMTSVRPLTYEAEDGIVLYPRLSGTPLSDHLRRPSQSVARYLERAGAALCALHQLPQAISGPLEPHDFAAEVKKIRRASKHITVLLPSVGSRIKALLSRAQELHERLPLEPPTFLHGDFKAEHVWLTPAGLTLLDFDRCRMGDPALDAGKFLADLRFWYAIYDKQGLQQAQEHFLAGYGPGAPVDRIVRARLYEAVEFVKMIDRRVHMFARDWALQTERLMGCAQAVLNNLQVTLGFPANGPHYRVLLVRSRT